MNIKFLNYTLFIKILWNNKYFIFEIKIMINNFVR